MTGFYKDILHKLQVVQRANGTKLVGVTLKDHKRNTWARGQNKVSNITKRKLKWERVGHYTRKKALGAKQRQNGDRRARISLKENHRQVRWYDDIKGLAGMKQLEIASDQERWHELNKAYMLRLRTVKEESRISSQNFNARSIVIKIIEAK